MEMKTSSDLTPGSAGRAVYVEILIHIKSERSYGKGKAASQVGTFSE